MNTHQIVFYCPHSLLVHCRRTKLVFTANMYYSIGALAKLKTQHQEDPNSSTLVTNKPTLLRSLFTVGALCRHFDFDQEEFKGSNKVNTSNLLKQCEQD